MKLYRAMKPAPDGLPAVGPTARTLGVRPGDMAPQNDVTAVQATDLLRPSEGGMSVAPDDPNNLPRHRRPATLGGTGNDPVWEIDDSELGNELQFRQDTATHGVIEPSRELCLAEFQSALAATRKAWRRVHG